MKFIGKMILGTVIVVVVLVVLLAMCTAAAISPSAPTPSPTATAAALATVTPTATIAATPVPTVAPVAKPLVLTGPGTMKTAKFHLAAGDYVATWKSADPNGVFGSYLQSTDPNDFVYEPIGVFQQSGSTNLYGIKDADYYLDVNSTSAWTVTLTQQ